jgi:beta-glucosidase
VFAGLPGEYESEGFDRTSLSMPVEHEELIRAVCAVNPKTAVVIQAGAPVDLAPAEGAAAILYAGLGGQAGGGATADILTGRVNPSGKLAETFPVAAKDTPCHGNFGTENRVVKYGEGALVGYRHYEANDIPAAYPFGHGLSYTAFGYSDRTETELIGGGKRVSVTVTNTGNRAGAETVLFYDAANPRSASDASKSRTAPDASKPQSAPTAANPAIGEESVREVTYRSLCSFEKVFLRPGESATVSADIKGEENAGGQPDATGAGTPAGAAESPARASEVPRSLRFDANSTPGDIRRTLAGFVFYFFLRLVLTLVYGTDAYARRMVDAMVNETPLRTISAMSGGLLPRPAINALIALTNIRGA